MYLLTINLYELGQFLRIVLWIFLPMAILSMLITTLASTTALCGKARGNRADCF